MKSENQSISKPAQLALIFKQAFENKNIEIIKKVSKKQKINIINQALELIENDDIIIFVLMILNDSQKRVIFQSLRINVKTNILNLASYTQIKIILKSLYPDEIVDMIHDFDKDETLRRKILFCLDSEKRNQIKNIFDFTDDQAGSIMNPIFFSFNSEWTVQKCIDEIRSKYESVEQNNSFFVVSENNKLLGTIALQDLIFCKDYHKKISSIMNESLISVSSNDDIEKIIEIFQDYLLDNLAVVNENNELIGIISHSDILPALEDEITEDIYNMYGITELKNSYIKSSIWAIIKSRLFWIVILMISATLTSIVIDRFQDLGDFLTSGISSFLLVPIIPVITGTSGNAGSQAVASVVRSLAVGEITRKEYGLVIRKEFLVGLIMGFILMLINFLRLIIFFAIPIFREIPSDVISNIKVPNTYTACVISALAASVALWIAIILSKTLGAILPLLANKFNIDPTVMSAPLIATILDVCSTSILFGIGIGVICLII